MSRAARMFAFVLDAQAPALPAGTAGRAVVGMICALAVAAGSAAALLALVGREDWWRGLIAATVVSTLATLLSMVPLVWGLRRSLHAAVAGYFVAMGVRMVVTFVGCVLAVKVGGYPADPTLLLLVALYGAVLLAETGTVTVALWTRSASKSATTAGAAPAAATRTGM